MSGRKVLIAGYGDLGQRMSIPLTDMGYQVWGLNRNPSNISPPVIPLEGDLTAPYLQEILPPDIDLFIYLATPSSREETAYRKTYIDGLSNLLRVLHESPHPIERFLFSSSTSVYGQNRGEWIDEESETSPSNFRGKILIEAESRVRQSPLPGQIARIGGLYGLNPPRWLLHHEKPTICPEPFNPSFTNRIHRDDAATALVHLLTRPLDRSTYLLVDCQPTQAGEIDRWVRLQKDLPQAAPTPQNTGKSGKRCSNRRLLESGFRFRYPTYREGALNWPALLC